MFEITHTRINLTIDRAQEKEREKTHTTTKLIQKSGDESVEFEHKLCVWISFFRRCVTVCECAWFSNRLILFIYS